MSVSNTGLERWLNCDTIGLVSWYKTADWSTSIVKQTITSGTTRR